jgi:hypothetical protein
MEDVWVVRSIDTKARPGPHQTVALLLVVDYVRRYLALIIEFHFTVEKN